MLEYKKILVQKEFPFLSKILGLAEENKLLGDFLWDCIGNIVIKKVDDNLLSQKGEYWEESGRWADQDHQNKASGKIYFAIFEGEPQMLKYHAYLDIGYHESSEFFADSIAEQLVRIVKTPEFLIELNWEYVEGKSTFNTMAMVIYKGKNFQFGDFHAKNLRKVANELAAELVR
jgi:hypothetical protein